MIPNVDYFKSFPFSITICDRKGIVVYLNDAAIREYASDGGAYLIGNSLINCHPEPARTKLLALLENPVRSSYVSQNGGRPLLIFDSPWLEGEIPLGIIEMLIPLEEVARHVN